MTVPGTAKAVIVDEAHRFLNGSASDGLSHAIVNAVRHMRHEGMRIIVSTQSPKVRCALLAATC